MQHNFHENVIYPPNRVFERNLNYSEIPIVYPTLFFIEFNSKKESILGSSNVSGTLWEGTTFYFPENYDLLDLRWSGYYIGPTACDAKFLDDKTVALAEDTGDLRIIHIDEKSKMQSDLFFRNYSRIPQIAIWNNSTKILTCCERNILILDTNSSKKTAELYEGKHTEAIYSVDSLKNNENCFVTCGADRKALIWDKRDVSNAQVLYSNEFASLTSIAWNQNNDNFIVCGSEGGDIYLIDKREPKTFLEVDHCFDNSIHRILFKPKSNLFAVCGDTNEIVAIDSNEQIFKNIYKSTDHESIVRGLAWCDNDLYSCGFDKKVSKQSFQ